MSTPNLRNRQILGKVVEKYLLKLYKITHNSPILLLYLSKFAFGDWAEWVDFLVQLY